MGGGFGRGDQRASTCATTAGSVCSSTNPSRSAARYLETKSAFREAYRLRRTRRFGLVGREGLLLSCPMLTEPLGCHPKHCGSKLPIPRGGTESAKANGPVFAGPPLAMSDREAWGPPGR